MTQGPRHVHVVVPAGIDDPLRPSGGNSYDRRLCSGLVASGWTVTEHHAPGAWPRPGPEDCAALGAALAAVPDGATVLVDGLVASAAPEVVCLQVLRLRVVVLVHLPLGVAEPSRRAGEAALLRRGSAVVTTSAWCRTWLVEHYGLEEARVGVAVPGVDPAAVGHGTATGHALLCVGAVTALKGHDLLLEALALIADLDWRMTWVGSLDGDPAFVGRLRARAVAAGVDDRLELAGPLTGDDLDAAYRAADVLVLASRAETYGMVVTEALARGLPVVASRTGGIAEAVGRAPDGDLPGLLVPPEDPDALATALRAWLEEPRLRAGARRAAAARRPLLPGWPDTVGRVAAVLAGR